MATIRLVPFAAALVATLAWASTGLAFEDPQPKDEALEGLTEALEKAEKGEPTKPAEKAEGPAPARESGPKAAEPEDKGAVAPKDQALDSLLEKLGETTETPAPADKRAGAPQPPDKPAPPKPDKPDPDELKGADKSLDDDLEARSGRRRKKDKDKDQEGEGSGPLAQVIKEMRDVEQRLQEPDTGEATRKKQAEIVKNLDTIIEQLRSTSSSSKSKSTRTVMQPGQKPGSQPGTAPGANGGQAPHTMPVRPSGKQGLADGRSKDEWGHLPEELRQEMANVFKEEYLTSKFDLIKLYYQSVARKSLVREE